MFPRLSGEGEKGASAAMKAVALFKEDPLPALPRNARGGNNERGG
jgi:hypothetical protein